MTTPLDDPTVKMLVIAILLKRLGGKATITQADIDDVAYNRILEEGHGDGSIELRFAERDKSS